MNLDNIKLFKDLSLDDKKNLSLFIQKKELKKWELLFKEWEDATSMYFLLEWKLKAFVEKNNEIIELWIIEPEEILWEMALFLDKRKRTASIVALEDSKLLTILDFSIKQLVQKNSELLDKIKNIINERKQINKEKIDS